MAVTLCIRGRKARSWCKPQSCSSAACSRARSLEALSARPAASAVPPSVRTAWRSAGWRCRRRRRTPPWVPPPGTCRSIGTLRACGGRCRTDSARPRLGAPDPRPGALCPAASSSHPQSRCLRRGVCGPARCSWPWASAPKPARGKQILTPDFSSSWYHVRSPTTALTITDLVVWPGVSIGEQPSGGNSSTLLGANLQRTDHRDAVVVTCVSKKKKKNCTEGTKTELRIPRQKAQTWWISLNNTVKHT